MARTSAMLLVGGGAGVLVMLGVLFHAVSSESAPEPATTSRTSNESVAAQTPRTSTSAPSAPRVRPLDLPAPAPAPGSPGSRTPVPSPGPEVSDPEAPPATRGNTKNLHFGGTQLRQQTAAVEPAVVKCIESAVASGQSPSGLATLTYIVVKKGDKYVVEDTGIDEDKTTLAGVPLLDCLRETSRGMKFEGLPREAEGLVVTRSVTVDNGKLAENKHVGFSYLR